MIDKEYKRQKKRFRKELEKWKDILGLSSWRITPYYHREQPDSSEHSLGVMAWVTADWRYMNASVHAVLPQIAELDDRELEYVVLHEYAHIVLNEMHINDPDFQAHEERLATMLGLSWQWLRDAALKGAV